MAAVLRVIEVCTAIGAAVYLVMTVISTLTRWRKSRQWLPLVVCLLWPAWSEAACDLTTVQGQIDAASSGDTVTISPASCSATWSSQLAISGKYLTLDLNGAVIERGSTTQPLILVTVNASGLTRITNGTLTELDDTGFPTSDVILSFTNCTYSASFPLQSFRVDHVTFQSDGVMHVLVNCHGRGLIDHNTFLWTGNREVIGLFGAGAGSATGWTDEVSPGSADAVYIEDNTFTNSASPTFNAGKTAQFYGSRSVVRFNTYDCAQIDVHGNTARSGRWWEIYHNNFLLGTCNNVDKWYQIRGGSGYIFEDTIEAGNVSPDRLVFWQDANPVKSTGGCHNVSGGEDSVGTGKNQTCDPAYVWNTNVDTISFTDDPGCSCVVENQDYFVKQASFDGTVGMGVGTLASRPATCTAGTGGAPGVGYWATDEGEWWAANAGSDGRLYKCTATDTWTLAYTPYTYPHPLIGGVSTSGSPILFIEWAALVLAGLWHSRHLVSAVCVVGVTMGQAMTATWTQTKAVSYQTALTIVTTLNERMKR